LLGLAGGDAAGADDEHLATDQVEVDWELHVTPEVMTAVRLA
jgi:hypothetical protein